MGEQHSERPQVRQVTVTAQQEGQRIDNFLRSELKGAPKSLIYRILRTGEVRINKGRARPETRLHAGDVVRLPPLRLAPEMPVQVGDALLARLRDRLLYEDDDLMAIDKPAGIAVHAGSGIRVGIIEALRVAFPGISGLELVHRLDRETSGILLLAKHRVALTELHALLREGRIDKTYLALVRGEWPERAREVNAPLAKQVLRGGERIVVVRPDGKPAWTRFRVVRRLPGATLVEAKPITGRTHQIRVHAQHLGHPVAGDEKYGDPAFDRALRPLGLARLFLHATSLGITRAKAPDLQLEAPLPDPLLDLLERLV
jgi:23S rRNA pseudouridine955/2504/2580 synthase